MENTLYYGDNLDILKRYVKDETVDLVYLDPPFKSNQDYNVLFAEQSGERAAAQIMAFEDTWHWDEAASRAYEETILAGGKTADVMRAFQTFLGGNDMLAYLSMMAPRLVELRRVLKPTGSIYLHCDPTASHYLKLLMDAIFNPDTFKNEIVWRRTPSTGSSKAIARKYPSNGDSLLFYTKSDQYTFNPIRQDYSEKYKARYRFKDERGFYYLDNLKTFSKERFELLVKEDRIAYTKAGTPRIKNYLHEGKGVLIDNIWIDIQVINSQAAERLGYPTQKPEALLERIIKASSNEGDVVLDPFCGCGTAIAVAQKLNRKWIGIDITHLAITLIKKRLKDQFDATANKGLKPLASTTTSSRQGKGLKPLAVRDALSYRVIGEPVALQDARELADKDKYQFQWWALGLVDARPVEQKKGADQGIDGRRYFIDGKDRHTEQVIFSVKGGHVNAAQVRDLRGVVEREKAAVGVFITLDEPTKPMKKEAADAGFYYSNWLDTKHPRLQILTIEELLEGKELDLPRTAFMPASDATFKKAPKTKRTGTKNEDLDLD
ncbi:site-specific DNA-methyltransferase [candidate division KSB1 bacterium]|nr:MAG: site-specific DNA-methyltransferase [candidate division KSB1 bacterium]